MLKPKEFKRKSVTKFELNQRRKYFNSYSLKRDKQLRSDLFKLLGGKKCKKCGFSDERALQFDHKRGGGCKDRKSYKFYLNNPKLAKKTLQILCANCNWIKRFTKKEQPYKSV